MNNLRITPTISLGKKGIPIRKKTSANARSLCHYRDCNVRSDRSTAKPVLGARIILALYQWPVITNRSLSKILLSGGFLMEVITKSFNLSIIVASVKIPGPRPQRPSLVRKWSAGLEAKAAPHRRAHLIWGAIFTCLNLSQVHLPPEKVS